VQEPVAADRQVSERESQGVALVGKVAPGILHDFNNVLTVITGTIDILAQAVADRPELAAVARLIDEAANRGARLTSQLLWFARGHPPHPRDIDVDELLADVGRLLRPTLGTDVEVLARVVPGTPTAFADPGQLMAALLCLGVTARDAMADGGRLVFEARPTSPSPGTASGVAVLLTAQANGGRIGPPDRMSADIRLAEQFVVRSNGSLVIGEAGTDFSVEISLPRGEALLA
jgi:nitrogen-specific signal transduction histidine kinase